MPESDVIALVAALAAVGLTVITWLSFRASGRRVRITAAIFHDSAGKPRIKLTAINSTPREVEIRFSNVLFKGPSIGAQLTGVEDPLLIWWTAHINWAGPRVPHRLKGDAQTTWWGDAYMVEYKLGSRVGPSFRGKMHVNLGGRTKFVKLVFKDWANTYFPPHDRPEPLEDVN
jgi:hypothetical protein